MSLQRGGKEGASQPQARENMDLRARRELAVPSGLIAQRTFYPQLREIGFLPEHNTVFAREANAQQIGPSIRERVRSAAKALSGRQETHPATQAGEAGNGSGGKVPSVEQGGLDPGDEYGANRVGDAIINVLRAGLSLERY